MAVLINPALRGPALRDALAAGQAERVVADRPAAEGASSVEALLAADAGPLPEDAPRDAGCAEDLALLFVGAGGDGAPRAARITNRRWGVAALGVAAACRLTPADTVHCAPPLHHAAGMLMAVGGALVGGARLALAPRFVARSFWPEVRRAGATVVSCRGDLCRPLVDAAPAAEERRHPVRLLAGSGMPADIWEALQSRFGARVLELYASTAGNAVLVNLGGDKVGSVGRELFPGAELALVRYDAAAGEYLRDATGHLVRCGVDEPGALLARIEDARPLARFDGYADLADTAARVLRDVFTPGDAWYAAADMLRRDADGDYWFEGRLASFLAEPARVDRD